MQKDSKFCKTQASITLYFDSDLDPSIFTQILGIKPKRAFARKDADVAPFNPNGYGFFQIATNVAEEQFAEHAITTLLRPFITKEKEILDILNSNSGYCQLDLFVKVNQMVSFPDITLSKNVLKLLSSINAKFKVNFV